MSRSDHPNLVRADGAGIGVDDAEAGVPNGPFEWLTNFDSLRHLLDPAFLFPPNGTVATDGGDDGPAQDDEHLGGRGTTLARLRRRRVLNVGCGTSTMGESLVEQLGYAEVVNADVDAEALRTMERRWRERIASSARRKRGENSDEVEGNAMRWVCMDFSAESDDEAERATDDLLGGRTFDVVLDKSTLDCALCSDDAASGLLCRAYRSLRCPPIAERGSHDGSGDTGGVYIVVSFHPKEFILPLLTQCPGAEWDVEHHVVRRDVDIPEHLEGRPGFEEKFRDEKKEEEPPRTTIASPPSSAWRDGTFSPDDEYRRTANVFLCRRRPRRRDTSGESCTSSGAAPGLDRDAVREHVHRTNDEWFRVHNPMVTHAREGDLRRAFEERLAALAELESDGVQQERVLPLRECYNILFTDAEREHLEYGHFLEDWEAFTSVGGEEREGNGQGMTVDAALRFLEEMQ